MLLKSITIFWGFVIAWLSLYPFEVDHQGLRLFPNADKVVHLSMHAMMAFLLSWNIQPKHWASKKALFLCFFAILYGTVIELLQEFMALGRSFDFWDIVANSAGVFIGLTGYFMLKKG